MSRVGEIDINTMNMFISASLLKNKRLSNAKATIAHEYGHLVFIKNMGSSHQDWKTFYEKTMVAEQFRQEHFEPIYREFKIAAKNYTNALGSAHELEAKATYRRLEKMRTQLYTEWQRKIPYPPLELSLSAPYQELFADLLAVTYTKNPRIISGLDKDRAKALTRNFAHPTPVKGWKDKTPHGLFAPTRHFLWKNYLAKPPMEKIFKAIQIELDELAKLSSTELEKLTPEILNQRLIDSITLIATP